jgi:hypothetical protein
MREINHVGFELRRNVSNRFHITSEPAVGNVSYKIVEDAVFYRMIAFRVAVTNESPQLGDFLGIILFQGLA